MICAYCKKEKKATREHIIPKSLIEFFPECDYVFDRKSEGTKVYKSESVVKDVCSDCNNGELSKLDGYGAQFIKKYFLREYSKDEIAPIEYNYNLLSRWLLKIIFNSERALKKETLRDTLWFDENLAYILGVESEPKYYISIFSGIFVNSSPMPLFWANNIQLDIISNPVLLLDGLLTPNDALGLSVKINKNAEDMKLENLYLKYLIKFGTGMFLVLMWDKNADQKLIKSYEWIIDKMFPYKIVSSENTSTDIERCTHPFNIISTQIIDSYVSMDFADRTNCFMPLDKDPMKVNEELSVNWGNYIKNIREEKAKEKQSKK